MKELTPEQRKKRIEMGVKLGLLVLAGLLVAPIVVTAIKGLLGAAVAAIIGVAIIQFAPVVAMKISNWKLKAIKAEAAKNPVETLQLQYVKKDTDLKTYKEKIGKFIAQLLTYTEQVKQYVKEGLEDAQVYVDQLEKMKQLLEFRKAKFKDAEENLAEFLKTIGRTDKKWKMACAAIAMNEAAGEMEGDIFDKICIETAIEAVTNKLNQSFAELEVALLDEDQVQKKEVFTPSRVQSLEIEQPQTVKSSRK